MDTDPHPGKSPHPSPAHLAQLGEAKPAHSTPSHFDLVKKGAGWDEFLPEIRTRAKAPSPTPPPISQKLGEGRVGAVFCRESSAVREGPQGRGFDAPACRAATFFVLQLRRAESKPPAGSRGGVPKVGIEPTFLSEHDFESCAYACSATSAGRLSISKFARRVKDIPA